MTILIYREGIRCQNHDGLCRALGCRPYDKDAKKVLVEVPTDRR